MSNILKEEVTANPEKQVLVRSTLPQHFYSIMMGIVPDGYYNASAKGTICWNTGKIKNHFTNFYLEQIAKNLGFNYVDSAPIFVERWDMHFPKKRAVDCSHWCYSPEYIVPELAVFNTALR